MMGNRRGLLERVFGDWDKEPRGIDLRPASAFEAVTRQMVEDVAEQLRDLRGRIDWLIFVIASAIVGEFLGRFFG